MVIKSATYSGMMNLKGEIRESISLDEDDISDVEDEVFIRDGKNGFKLAEEMNVKRPLMAPRRRYPKQTDSKSRLKPRTFNCRTWGKPCCYIFTSLSVLIGLIALVAVLVSIYPLPLDRVRDWITAKPSKTEERNKSTELPCTVLTTSEIWKINFPFLTSESPVRALDVDGDGTKDLIFGFGTGNGGDAILPSRVYCRMFFNIEPPCEGGLIALNGKSGHLLWKTWLNDTIFSIQCDADVNLDGINDCLVTGVQGLMGLIDAKTGKIIWQQRPDKRSVFMANFLPDVTNDSVSDIIAAHSALENGARGHVMLFNGRTGQEILNVPTPSGAKTFFMPQLLDSKGNLSVLYGTGSPNSGGNLSLVALNDLGNLTDNSRTIYRDELKGMLTQAVLTDITRDNITDIVVSTYNSKVVAIDGLNYSTIWEYEAPNGVTEMAPTPGYFNSDDVPDFLVLYQMHDSIFGYNYTQTLIIDGSTGKPIYGPISSGVATQLGALTMRMEGKGTDIYLFWIGECFSTDGQGVKGKIAKGPNLADECRKQFNSSTILKLSALNSHHQPPGITIYNSALETESDVTNNGTILNLLRQYLKNPARDNLGHSELSRILNRQSYGKSSFRHKDRPDSGLIKDFGPEITISNNDQPSSMDYNIWVPQNADAEPEFSNYNLGDDNIPYNQKRILFAEVNSRDPRSKTKSAEAGQTKKKNLSDKIFGYRNVKLAKDRLLQDEDTLPTDILKDTYFKNEENRLKTAKFEQRDVNGHLVGEMDSLDIKQAIDAEKMAVFNYSTTLWDIENEHELNEREEKLYLRRKRDENEDFDGVTKVTSIGAVLPAISESANYIDIVFIKHWQSAEQTLDLLLKSDIKRCLKNNKEGGLKQCQEEQDNLKRNFPYFESINRLAIGQMTVYRMRIKCECDSSFNSEVPGRCAKFLPDEAQTWAEFLGKSGNGAF